jgi:predicted PurR-regulated permease PerM
MSTHKDPEPPIDPAALAAIGAAVNAEAAAVTRVAVSPEGGSDAGGSEVGEAAVSSAEPPSASPPESDDLRLLRRQNRLLAVLVGLAVLYTAQLAASLILPILVAALVSLMLAPPVRLLLRLRVPRVLSTVLVVGGIVLAFGAAVTVLVDPARNWMGNLPTSVDRIEKVVRDWRKPILAATKATEGLAHIGEIAAPPGAKAPIAVAAEPSSLSQLLASFPGVVASILGTLFLVVVFLARGEAVMFKLLDYAARRGIASDVVERAIHGAQHELSVYFLTITVVNLLTGAVLALILWMIGVDQPLLWGALAALLNYTPFVGPLTMTVLLVFAGFGEFATAGKALAVPAAYLALHLLESQLITPLTVGRRLTLDPLMVFLSLVVLGWLWGLVGLLIAVPMLTCCRIIAEHLPGGESVARLLAE